MRLSTILGFSNIYNIGRFDYLPSWNIRFHRNLEYQTLYYVEILKIVECSEYSTICNIGTFGCQHAWDIIRLHAISEYATICNLGIREYLQSWKSRLSIILEYSPIDDLGKFDYLEDWDVRLSTTLEHSTI